MRRWAFHLTFALLQLVSLTSRADPLLVTNESPVFVLDLRLPSADPLLSNLVVQAVSPAFVLNTRIPAPDVLLSNLIVQAVSPAFVLDTRLPSASPLLSNLVVQAVSSAFVLDTRIPVPDVLLSNLIVQAVSPAFALDTRLPAANPLLSNLVVQAVSPAFVLDTRLVSISVNGATVSAVSPAFTLDTRLIAPVITIQPANMVVMAGSSAMFTVAVTGPASLAYQWLFASNAIAGSTNATLMLINATRTNSGYYAVIVTSIAGCVTSSNALLRVLVPQRILPLTSLGGGRYRISFSDLDGGLLFPWDLDNLEIEGCTDLMAADWAAVTKPIVISNGIGQLEFLATNSPPQQFYRIRMR